MLKKWQNRKFPRKEKTIRLGNIPYTKLNLDYADSDPEESEESEEEVSEEGDESPADVDDDEPSEEEDEHYILGCMIKCQSGYECRYCPFMTCPNERTMRAHRHARLERIMKGESPGRDDVDYDEDGYDLETPPSQVFFF
ncbi:unnamed protein product [Brassica oleracea]